MSKVVQTFQLHPFQRHLLTAFVSMAVGTGYAVGAEYTYYSGYGGINELDVDYHHDISQEAWQKFLALKGRQARDEEYWAVAAENIQSDYLSNPLAIQNATVRGENIRQFVNAIRQINFGSNQRTSPVGTYDLGNNSLVISNEHVNSGSSLFWTAKPGTQLTYQGDGNNALTLEYSLKAESDTSNKGYYDAVQMGRSSSSFVFKDLDLNIQNIDTSGGEGTGKQARLEALAIQAKGAGNTSFTNNKTTNLSVLSQATTLRNNANTQDFVSARGLYVARDDIDTLGDGSDYQDTSVLGTYAHFNNLNIHVFANQKAVGMTSRLSTNNANAGQQLTVDFTTDGNLNINTYSAKNIAEGMVVEALHYTPATSSFKNTIGGSAVIAVQGGGENYAQGIKQTAVYGGKVNTVFKQSLTINDRVKNAQGDSLNTQNDADFTGLFMGTDNRAYIRTPIYEGWVKRGYDYSSYFNQQLQFVYEALAQNPSSKNTLSVQGPLSIQAQSSGSLTGIELRDIIKADTSFTAKDTTTINLTSQQASTGLIGRAGDLDLMDISLENYRYTPTGSPEVDLQALYEQNESINNTSEFYKTVDMRLKGAAALGLDDTNWTTLKNWKQAVKNGKLVYVKDENDRYISRVITQDHRRHVQYHFHDTLNIDAQATEQNALGIQLITGINGSQTVKVDKGTNIHLATLEESYKENPTYAIGVYLSSPTEAELDPALVASSADAGNVGNRVLLEGPTHIDAQTHVANKEHGYVSMLEGKLSHLRVNTQNTSDSIKALGHMSTSNGAQNTWFFNSPSSYLKGDILATDSGKNALNFANNASWTGKATRQPKAERLLRAANINDTSNITADNPEISVHDTIRVLNRQQADAGLNNISLNNARWNMTDTSYLSHLDMNNNAIANMRADDNRYSYLVAENLTGTGGTILQDIDVRTMESDKVLVHGNFTGEHYLDIYQKDNYRPAEDDYVEGVGLVLARVKSGDGVFKAKDREDTLFYTHYELDHKPSEYKDSGLFTTDWYLKRATRINPEIKPTPTVIAEPSIRQAIYLGWRQDLDKLLQRMGELRQHNFDNEGAWFRAKGNFFTHTGTFGSQSRFNSYEIGYDKKKVILTDEAKKQGYKEDEINKDKLKEEKTPNNLVEKRRYRGGSVSFNEGRINYQNGRSYVNGIGLSLYQSDIYTNGAYRDLILRYNFFDHYYRTTDNKGKVLKGDDDIHAVSFSIEGGRKYQNDNGWYIEPQAQAVLGWMSGSAYTLSNGTHIKTDHSLSLIGRAGFNLGKEFDEKRGIFYAKLNVLHEFLGKSNTYYAYHDDSAKVHQNWKGTWWQYGLGVSYRFDDKDNQGKTIKKGNKYFYFDVERNVGKNIGKNWQWNAGFRYMF